jgi:hypothetical protein
MEDQTEGMLSFCMRCHRHTVMVDLEEVRIPHKAGGGSYRNKTSKQRKVYYYKSITKGRCSICGAGMTRMGRQPWHKKGWEAVDIVEGGEDE